MQIFSLIGNEQHKGHSSIIEVVTRGGTGLFFAINVDIYFFKAGRKCIVKTWSREKIVRGGLGFPGTGDLA